MLQVKQLCCYNNPRLGSLNKKVNTSEHRRKKKTSTVTLASANVLNIPVPKTFKCLFICAPIAVANVVQMLRVMVTW